MLKLHVHEHHVWSVTPPAWLSQPVTIKFKGQTEVQHQLNGDPWSIKPDVFLCVSMTTLSSDWPQCREHVSAWSIKRKVENRTRWKKQEEETVATETSCFPRSFWACSKKVLELDLSWKEKSTAMEFYSRRKTLRKWKVAFSWGDSVERMVKTLTATGESRSPVIFHD